MIKRKLKKSQSQIVSSVLLILISIIAIMMIIGFIIPFIQNQLSKGNCIEIINQIEIQNNPKYTCWDVGGDRMLIQVHVSDNEPIKGFAIELGGASSNTIEITDDTDVSTNVHMYHEIDEVGNKMIIPDKNEEKTYNLTTTSGKPDSIRLYPIMTNGVTCDKADVLNKINNC